MSTTYKNIVATVLGLALMFALAFTLAKPAQANALNQDQINAIINLLVTFQADQATLDNVRAALTGQPSNNGGNTGNTGGNTSGSCVAMTFTMNHKMGDRGGEVMNIQKFLNANGFQVAASGPGSAGMETSYFGPATKAAVIRFQNAYASEILAPVGLSTGTGYWGNSTRAKANAMEQARCAAQNNNNNNNNDNNNDDNNNNQDANELTVAGAAQPTDSLAPEGAKNVPFTRFTLSGNATVDEVVVELTGLADRSNFRTVAILDENGNAVTRYKTINSDNEVKFTKDFTVNGAQTYTVVVEMADPLTGAGQLASFAVKSIKADKPVNGSLPIVGASHTLNNTLQIAALTVSESNVGGTANIGDEEVTILDADFTAANEDVKIEKVLLKNRGSADLNVAISNITVEFDNNTYTATVTDDDEITVDLSGYTLDEGTTETLVVKADIVGENGETIELAVDDDELMADGATYGYGANVTVTENTSVLAISGAEITVDDDNDFDSSNTATPDENDVVIAMFEITNTTGEDVIADSFDVNVTIAGHTNVANNNLEDVRLYQGNTEIASFGDVSFTGGVTQTVSFTDITLAPGNDVKYSIKANIDNNAEDSVTYTVGPVTFTGDTETANGDDVSTDVTSYAAQTTTITTGTAELRATTDSINDPKAVKTSTDDVVLAEFEVEANDAELTLDDMVVNLTGDTLISGDLRVVVDGQEKASENPAATVNFSNMNLTIAKDGKIKIQLVADMGSTAGTVDIDSVTIATTDFETPQPSAVNGTLVDADFGEVTVTDALPVVTPVNTGTITINTSYVADKNVLEFSIKADGDDVYVGDVVVAKVGTVTFPNAELIVYSDASHNNEVITVAAAGTLDIAAAETFTVNETISNGDTYYFVVEADVSGTSGDYATLTVADAAGSITLSTDGNMTVGEPTDVTSDLVLEDDMKTTVNTAL